MKHSTIVLTVVIHIDHEYPLKKPYIQEQLEEGIQRTIDENSGWWGANDQDRASGGSCRLGTSCKFYSRKQKS